MNKGFKESMIRVVEMLGAGAIIAGIFQEQVVPGAGVTVISIILLYAMHMPGGKK